MQNSAQSSSDQSLRGKRFLKSSTAVALNNSNTAAAAAAATSPQGPDVRVRSRSRAADATLRVVGGISLESDEEDMKKLLGDSLDSEDKSFLTPGNKVPFNFKSQPNCQNLVKNSQVSLTIPRLRSTI